jgi:hypothetical protein
LFLSQSAAKKPAFVFFVFVAIVVYFATIVSCIFLFLNFYRDVSSFRCTALAFLVIARLTVFVQKVD